MIFDSQPLYFRDRHPVLEIRVQPGNSLERKIMAGRLRDSFAGGRNPSLGLRAPGKEQKWPQADSRIRADLQGPDGLSGFNIVTIANGKGKIYA